MINDPTILLVIMRGCLWVAAVCTTAFPLLYLFSPWYGSKVGRVIMMQGLAFALAMDLTLLFQYWIPKDHFARFAIQTSVLFLIAVATAALTVVLWVTNHKHRKRIEEFTMTNNTPKAPLLNDQMYLWLKNAAMVILPAIGALYFGLAALWGLPSAEEVVGTVTLLATFIGALVKLGERSYDNSDASNTVGTFQVVDTEDGKTYQLDLGDTDPEVIDRSGKIVFNVAGS